jgi:predicted permease
MIHALDDLRYAARRLWHRPAFTIAALLTLTLGLGANIAVFSLMHAVLLRSLPVERPGELYRLGETQNCCVNSGLQGSYSLYSTQLAGHLRDGAADFTDLALFQATTQSVSVRHGAGAGESLRGQYVSANYFRMFGVRPAAGRLLEPDDDSPGAAPVVVLSHQVWADRFGSDPGIVGDTLVVNGTPVTVAGVAGAGFFGDTIRPNPAGVWIPLGQEPAMRGEASLADRSGQDWLYAMGRLRDDVAPEAVSARMTTALRHWLDAQAFLTESQREALPQQHIVVTPSGGGVPIMRAQFGQALTVLLVTSGLVLLIAAANLANLLLAGADRGQAAIRAALGAPVSRLVRQPLIEGVLLAIAGSALALWVATSGARLLVATAFPAALAAYVPVDLAPNPTMLAFALGLAVVTGVLFSVGPAWAMSTTPPLEALSGVGRSGSVRTFVPKRVLVVAQVALTFVLLTGAGLLLGTLGALERQALGFDPVGRTVVHIDPPTSPDPGEQSRRYEAMREALGRIPGVHAVSYALYSPMEGNNWSGGISIAGRASDPAAPDISSWNRVGPDYFDVTGTRVLRGRALLESEMVTGARVAVVNDTFRRQFFAGLDPIGQRLGVGGPSHAGDYEVVGVVDDVRYMAPRQPVRPMIFLPAFRTADYESEPGGASVQARSMQLRTLVLHAAVPHGQLEPAVRQALADADRDVTVARVVSLEDQVSANFRIERLMANLTTVYGLLALALAAVGLYGVTAFGVRQRTREIGVRLALGAGRPQIIRAVLAGPLVQTLLGLAVGVPAALFATGAISTQLHGVEAGNPLVFGTAALGLLVTTAVAALVPAWRATAIDPTDALRSA